MLTREALRKIADDHNNQTEIQRVAEKAAQNREIKNKADTILGQLDARMLAEASAGRTHAVIMGLRPYVDTVDNGVHYTRGQSWGRRLDPQRLVGAAVLVYQGCVDRQLEPSIEYWFDGCDKDGFNIVVHW